MRARLNDSIFGMMCIEHQDTLARNPLSTISSETLLLIVTMQLNVSEMLSIDYQRQARADVRYRVFMVADSLVKDAQKDPSLGHRLYDALSKKLRWANRAYSEYRVTDFAHLWAHEKSSLHGTRLAGFLWAIATSTHAALRRLENVIVSDLKYRAYESLSHPVPQTIRRSPS